MKKTVIVFIAFAIILCALPAAHAADGRVIYLGEAEGFVFEPGSEESVSDLFPNFKGVMPGDSLTQKVTLKNDVSKNVKVKFYIRSLGAHEESAVFLSKLGLRVKKSEDNSMAYMFDAAANETAGLTDWVYLGTLYSGGEVNLDVILDVPAELGNEFQNSVGYLDWEIMIEELEVEDDDPDAPPTGDRTDIMLYAGGMACALLLIIILFVKRKREKDEEYAARG